jgi:hypothetical protein
MEANIGK